MAVIVHANFLEDLREHHLQLLKKAGLPISDPNDLDHVLFAYFSIKRRLIPACKRRVERSRELKGRGLSPSQQAAIDRIASEFEHGEEMTRRLSRSIMKPEFNDGLLDDWGIHHLHIGSKIEADGFIKRDGPLLYVLVRPDVAYLIDLLGHGHASFANELLLGVVHDNWPAVIAAYRAPFLSHNSAALTTTERTKARACLITLTQVKDGTLYFPPGGGASTAGLSPRVVAAADRIRDTAQEAEKWVRANAEWIRSAIAEERGLRLDELQMRCLFINPLSVIELQSKAMIRVPFAAPEPPAPVQL